MCKFNQISLEWTNHMFNYNHKNKKFIINDDARIVSQMRSSRMRSSSYILILKKRIGAMMHRCGACHGASDAKVRTNSPERWEKFCLNEVRVSVVLSLPFPPGAHVYIYIYIYMCVYVQAPLYPLGHWWWYSFSLCNASMMG